LTVSQLDQLQKIARKVNLASLAVRALGVDPSVEEQLVDVLVDLRALGGEGRAQARDSCSPRLIVGAA
jgi:hypothetical protein